MAKAMLVEIVFKRIVILYLVIIVLVALAEVLLPMWQTYAALGMASVVAYLRLFGFGKSDSGRSTAVERSPYEPADDIPE